MSPVGTPTEQLTRQLIEEIRAGLQAPPPEIGQGAALSTYAVNLVASSGAQSVFVLGILRQRRGLGSKETTLDPAPTDLSVGTTSKNASSNNADRVALLLVNNGSVAIAGAFDAPAVSAKGFTIAPNGGVVMIIGNEVKVYGPATARSAPDDRNATNVRNVGDQTPGAGPLGTTTNWTYTVPANRKCRVELLQVYVRNNSANAINAEAASAINYAPGGVSNFPILTANAETGEASFFRSVVLGLSMTLYAGDVLKDLMSTGNNAAGTALDMESFFKGTEYDA